VGAKPHDARCRGSVLTAWSLNAWFDTPLCTALLNHKWSWHVWAQIGPRCCCVVWLSYIFSSL